MPLRNKDIIYHPNPNMIKIRSFKIFVEKVERKGVSRTFVKGCFIKSESTSSGHKLQY